MRRLAFLTLLALPAVLPAQTMPGTVIRRGPGDALALSDGEPISFILEFAQLLDLTDEQRTGLMNIRRRLRSTNAPHMRQLDSLRQVLSISLEPGPRGIGDEERKKLQRFEQLSQPFADSLKANNDAARVHARQLLDSVQVVRLDSITKDRGTPERRPPPR